MKVQHDCKQQGLDSFANALSDNDNEWWPFLDLRPAAHERLTTGRCLALGGLYCVPAVLVSAIAGALFSTPAPLPTTLGLVVLSAWAAAFVAFKWGVAGPWNRRAQGLEMLRRRRALWVEGHDGDGVFDGERLQRPLAKGIGQQRNDRQNQKPEEQDLCDSGRRSSDASKAKQRGH